MPSPEIRLAVTDADRAAATAVRIEVFVGEQGVPQELEIDALDAVADHFVAYLDGEPAGAARLLAEGGEGVLGRLAVRKPARGGGLGAELVRAVEIRAGERGLSAVRLHAQTQAESFYTRLGYTPFGAVEDEVGIPHIWMIKPL